MQQKATQSYPIQSTDSVILDKVREISRRYDIVSLNRQIEVSGNLLGQSEVIDIAILGQFKAGKSSFINSLIGGKILPVGVIPVTTVITRLHYEKEPGAIVTYLDGTKAEAQVNDVEQFISEEKNPANEKNVGVVDLGLPAFERYPGLRLVDTPGLGSAFRYNTETSREWLPEVGAAIVAVSAERPLSENDLNLIKDLARHTPKIILLLTKVDLLSSEQQKEVIRFLQNTLKRENNSEIPIYPYSTTLRTDLFRGQIDDLLLSLSRNCDYDIIRSELFLISRENMHKTRTLIAAHLETKRHEFTKKLITRLREEMPTWKGSLWRLTRRYEEWLEENLKQELNDLSKREHPHFFGTLKSAHMSVSRSLELFRNLLDSNIESILGVRLSPPDWDLDVPEPTHPDVAFTKVFNFHFDLLWFLIPMFIFRAVFQRHKGYSDRHPSSLTSFSGG